MKNNLPLVSIIIPCRNEEKHIKRCLDSVMNQTFSQEKVEILVVDGMSEDKTRDIVKEYAKRYFFIKLLNNPKRIFAAANNIGIKNAKGEIVMILGAHAVYPNDYIERCVKCLKEYNVDNVGGNIEAIPSKKTLIAKAIALSLGGHFGKGRVRKEKISLVDTVFGGCYRREIFNKIGFFNENLKGSSDIDLNMRLLENKGKILLISDLVVNYYPKDNLRDFFLHNIKDGIWVILPLKYTKRLMKLRHYLSLKIALKEKDIRLFFIMPIVFAVRHFGYGFGSLWGVIKLMTNDQ